MANFLTHKSTAVFRYVPRIDSLDDSQLKTHGYYRGFPCPFSHTIRDVDGHWCYHCAVKIQSNLCGYDVNYIDPYYKKQIIKLWQFIEVGDWEDCWQLKLPGTKTPKRTCFPSYRAAYSQQLSENISPHKAIYLCSWGDIGSMPVTRLCKNPWCGNPLHLVSSWNRLFPPQSLAPFDRNLNPAKLMAITKARVTGQVHKLIEASYRPTITHPLGVKDAPDYDEGG